MGFILQPEAAKKKREKIYKTTVFKTSVNEGQ